jgi:hypothetical protein
MGVPLASLGTAWNIFSMGWIQLLIDSSILKNFILLKGYIGVLLFLIRVVHDSIAADDGDLLDYFVEIGLLTYFISALTEEDWDADGDDLLDAGGHEFSIFGKLKDATVCVMKFDPEYRDMVLQMNLPASLKDELKRKSRVKKRKRKLSEDERGESS